MSLTTSAHWMYSSGSSFYPYTIDQSLRFEDGSGAYLSRTPSSAGNLKNWTWSAWVKRGNLNAGSDIHTLFSQWEFPGNYQHRIVFSDDRLTFMLYDGGANSHRGSKTLDMLFRDVSAWYHIVCVYDSPNATAADRMRVYVNGERITAFGGTGAAGQPSSINPSLNLDGYVNRAQRHTMGTFYDPDFGGAFNFNDGYMSEINFVDGSSLDASSFGETKDGIWIPKEYSGSYGTNGFYLDFANSSAIGNDVSGNNNDWTPVNLAATDVVLDSPTNNFATLNPLDSFNSPTFSEGNLKLVRSSGYGISSGTIAVNSGKWYWEIRCPTVTTSGENESFGISKVTSNVIGNNYLGINTNSWALMIDNAASDIYFNHNNSFTDSGINASNGDIFMFALDADTGKLWFGRNGTWFDSGNPSAGTNQKYTANTDDVYYVAVSNLGDDAFILNFGQDSTFAGGTTAGGNTDGNGKGDFKYSVPSGYLALCTANLPEPEIIDGSEYFNTVLYSGNGGTQDITTVGFQSDWVWNKRRDGAASHVIYDSVRGTGNEIGSNYNAAEATGVPGVTAFLSNGYSLGNNGNINDSGETYASWNWLAGTAVSGNTTGSGTAKAYSGSVNTESGFSIIKYVGNGTSGHTIPHNLGAVPKMIIAKNRDQADDWAVYHNAIGAGNYLKLNSDGALTSAAQVWNDTTPSNSVFSVGSNHQTNANNEDYIAYCFADIDQYCKAGSYTGNGSSSSGPHVYTGFSPAFVLIKNTAGGGTDWLMFDNKREGYNPTDILYANSSTSEETSSTKNIDILSNGFKIGASTNAGINSSGVEYMYLSFSSSPFKYSNAR